MSVAVSIVSEIGQQVMLMYVVHGLCLLTGIWVYMYECNMSVFQIKVY